MTINSVSFLNNSSVELVKANAIQFANKNNKLNKVTPEKEVNKNNEIKDSAYISKEALELLKAEQNDPKTGNKTIDSSNKSERNNKNTTDEIRPADKDTNDTNGVANKTGNATNSSINVKHKLAALKLRKAYC